MKTKQKTLIIIIGTIMALTIIGLAIGIVLVAQRATIDNTMSVSYIADNVDVSVTATATKYDSDSDEGSTVTMNNGELTSSTIEFTSKQSSNQTNASINFDHITLTANGRVVYKFDITNTANILNTKELKVEAVIYDNENKTAFNDNNNVNVKIGSNEVDAYNLTSEINSYRANIGAGQEDTTLIVVLNIDNTSVSVEDYNLYIQLRFAYAKTADNPNGIGQDDWDGTIGTLPEPTLGVEDRYGYPYRTYTIYTAEELAAVAYKVNNTNNSDYYHGFYNSAIILESDIDLKGYEWTPIGFGFSSNTNYPDTITSGWSQDITTTGKVFFGTFDGNGHTIRNLKISDTADRNTPYGSNTTTDFGGNPAISNTTASAGVGFFGFVNLMSATIQNVNIANADVIGNNYVGALIGYAQKPLTINGSSRNGYIRNCHITTATVEGRFANVEDDGAKVGALIGYYYHAFAYDCSVSDSIVKGVRDSGQVFGCITFDDIYADYTYVLANIYANNVTFVANNTNLPSDYQAQTGNYLGKKSGNRIIGRNDKNATIQYVADCAGLLPNYTANG